MCKFFLNLADSLLQELPLPKSKFGIKSREKFYKQIQNECEDFVLQNADVTTIDKIVKNLDVCKASDIDQNSAKFLKIILY